jgi:hypothetical protein
MSGRSPRAGPLRGERMAQLFRPQANAYFRATIVIALLGALGAVGVVMAHIRSPEVWNLCRPAAPPIPFRHDLHVGGLGMDCRFCHNTVEQAASAGMPSAQTCMSCHSQIWVGAGALEPLRTSLALDRPIEWRSVHRLPGYAVFHHGIHVARGVTCATCHGPVEAMPRTAKQEPLSMGWCLDCHRNPHPFISPQMAAQAAGWPAEAANDPVKALEAYDIAVARLVSCSTCHR